MESGMEAGNSIEPEKGFDADAEKKGDKGGVNGGWGSGTQDTGG